jgi:hypothetical protein
LEVGDGDVDDGGLRSLSLLAMANVAMSSGLMMVINAARNGFYYGVKVSERSTVCRK